ncbi:MAG: spore germination protein [Clostridia bacterium]|nr:spore germination protein [Clostridia bacterium]
MNYSVKQRIGAVKKILPSEDILVFEFESSAGKKFAVIYADGIVDKNQIGELVIKPLHHAESDITAEEVKKLLASPDVKDGKDLKDAIKQISDGNAVLYTDGEKDFFVIGVKNPPGRAVAEPPTQVTVKGPREGFTEDIKVNLGLVRKRVKSDKLKVKTLTVGKQSQTAVAICYIEGVCPEGLPEKIEKQIKENEIDIIPDSSYVAALVSERPHSLFKRNATCEKPDIFCSKMCEGRVGIIADGSPIALTVPYMLVEDFQTAEDYYAVSYRSTILRVLRLAAVLIGILLPAIYVCAQLFKIQLIPAQLLFKIASSVAGIPLSPSVEIFLTLFVLEVLNEASIRMPKYVGLALSVVGALVLGDTAVKAGIISTPAVIIIAFSAICLYTVPDLVETSTTLRLVFLIIAGSIGTYGVILAIAFLLCYLVTEQDYGVPLLAPYAPLIGRDMRDSLLKSNAYALSKRPKVFKTKNRVRLKTKK